MTTPATSNRVIKSIICRLSDAEKDALIPAPQQFDNGDEARYADKSGTYTKGIKQQSNVGFVNIDAYISLKCALSTGNPIDFQNIQVGAVDPQKDHFLNGPQGGLAFNLDCPTMHNSQNPLRPLCKPTSTPQVVEMYWGFVVTGHPIYRLRDG